MFWCHCCGRETSRCRCKFRTIDTIEIYSGIAPFSMQQHGFLNFEGFFLKSMWTCGRSGGMCKCWYLVPAEIVAKWSSNDVTVQEGESVWLHCNVTGVPPPTVTWRRRTTSGRDIHDCRQRTVDAGMRTWETEKSYVASDSPTSLAVEDGTDYSLKWLVYTGDKLGYWRQFVSRPGDILSPQNGRN